MDRDPAGEGPKAKKLRRALVEAVDAAAEAAGAGELHEHAEAEAILDGFGVADGSERTGQRSEG